MAVLPRLLIVLLGAALPLVFLYCADPTWISELDLPKQGQHSCGARTEGAEACATSNIALLAYIAEAGGEIGVSYGRNTNALGPGDQAAVVKLLKQNGITKVRIYDANPQVLTSLANTGIKVMVMLPNQNVAAAAQDPSYALQWVRSSVQAYLPATQITSVAVGNEIFDSAPGLTSDLVPAMTNVQAALATLGLADAVKVSTPVAIDALETSFPPSQGSFKGNIAPVVKDMLGFLQRTGSYFTLNVYPFFAYNAQPDKIPLPYALGNYKDGVRDDVTGIIYHSLLDAQLDATYHAMEDLGFPAVSLSVTETGHPSAGQTTGPKPPTAANTLRAGGAGRRRLLDAGAATIANAQAYNNYVINRVLAGQTGTPHRPDADMDVYIFALFNENLKGSSDDIEAHFGLFDPETMQKVYEFDFVHGTGPVPEPTPSLASWCVANAAVGDARLQDALDWACGHGADCSDIQPGARCFDPDTKLAHASYAFNSYYQKQGRTAGACDFSGAGTIVYQEPADTCGTKASSWCVAKSGVSDAELQKALDYACGNGADCSAIQPGGACFNPDTKSAHASYAFNSYYQNKHQAAGTCDFSGAATIVYQAPKIGNCVLPSNG
ncbi:hypothetical protein ACP4OV_009049 [Aristida adscensionis]